MTRDAKLYESLIQPIEDQMIRSVWRILRDPDDAEDAFQEALTTVWRRRKRISRHPNPQAFILKTCVSAACDILRRRMRHRARREESRALPEVASDSAPLDELARKEEAAQVWAAISQLSRNQAVAVLMKAMHAQSHRQIAQGLGCSEATVRTHLARARDRLRHLLRHLDPSLSKEAIP